MNADKEIKVGDTVTRLLAETIKMQLRVSEVTATEIICGPWKFSKTTLGEIDEHLGWDGVDTGSRLLIEDRDDSHGKN